MNCRVCLQVEELMVHIYEEVEDLQSNLSTLLERCGGLKVDQSDCYPKYLCKECTSELLIAAKFREKCERTQQVLQHIEWEQAEETMLDAKESLDMQQIQPSNIEHFCINIAEEGQKMISNTADQENEREVLVEELDADTNIGPEPEPSYDVNELIVFGIDDVADSGLDQELIVYVDEGASDNISQQQEVDLNHEMQMGDSVHHDEPQQAEEEGVKNPDVISMFRISTLLPLSPVTVPHFVCDICGALFQQSLNLKRHMDRLHLPMKYFTCQMCQHCFSMETEYAQHCSSCDYRNQVAGRTTKVNSHRKKPSAPVTKYKQSPLNSSATFLTCSYCGKGFKNAFAHDMHLRTHTGERPFICEHCPKSFKIQAHLNTHIKRHAGLPDFACTECGKKFYESSNLTAHMRTHTNERPHACSHCSKRFTRVFLLQLHMRTHTGEKPYQCEDCDRSFAQVCDLKNHIRTHSGERSFQCPLCPKSFIKRHPLLQHLKKHSSVDIAVGVQFVCNQAV